MECLDIFSILFLGGSMSYLKTEELKEGWLYRINARNAKYGIWCEKDMGFYISRVKFGRNYLFVEIHWDLSPSFGTVKPIHAVEESGFDTSKLDDWQTPEHLEKEVLEYLNKYEPLSSKERQ